MPLKFSTSADRLVSLPLANDPDVLGVNSEGVISRYILLGDMSELVVPEGSTYVTVRPLTASEFREANRDAGLCPPLGAMLADQLSIFETQVRQEAQGQLSGILSDEELQGAYRWVSSDGKEGDAAAVARVGEIVGAKVREATARKQAEWTPAELSSHQAFVDWSHKVERGILSRGLVGVSNWDVPRADLLRTLEEDVFPLDLQRKVWEEIVYHIKRLSLLGPAGKE